MEHTSKIMVVDSADMLGSAICRSLERQMYRNILPVSSGDLNLVDQEAVLSWYKANQPEYVFCFAGLHGGIAVNQARPAEFIYQDLTIQNNLIHGAYLCGVKRLLFLAGSCVYPKECPQPIKEEAFQTGPMEPTSVAYSMARCAGIEMCLAYNRQYHTEFIPAVFSNYFGIEDDYSENGHVLAGMMKRMYITKLHDDPQFAIWGTGTPIRQFLYMDDLADGAVCVMQKLRSPELINIAGGFEKSIQEVAVDLKRMLGYSGELFFDCSKPDGAMRKTLDSSKLRTLGWRERFTWERGLETAYQWFLEHIAPSLS